MTIYFKLEIYSMEIFIRAKHLKANIILRKKIGKNAFRIKKHYVLFFLIFFLTYFTIYNRRWILFYCWCQLKSSYKSFYVTIRSGYNQIIVNKTFLLTVENLWFSLFFSTQPILKSTKFEECVPFSEMNFMPHLRYTLHYGWIFQLLSKNYQCFAL